jgi:multiple sugar transport system ATP-binding protein
MTMGDRVAVMRKGELQQVGSPQELYDTPLNLFVGGFIGSPAMNMLAVTIAEQNGGLVAEGGDQRLVLSDEKVAAHPALKDYVGRSVVLGIRPEDLEDAALAKDAPSEQRLKGKVLLTEALGSEVMAHFTVDIPPAETAESRELAEDVGVESLPQDDDPGAAEVVGRFGARTRIKAGDDVEVAVDTRGLHFFDPQTGLGIYNGTNNKGVKA